MLGVWCLIPERCQRNSWCCVWGVRPDKEEGASPRAKAGKVHHELSVLICITPQHNIPSNNNNGESTASFEVPWHRLVTNDAGATSSFAGAVSDARLAFLSRSRDSYIRDQIKEHPETLGSSDSQRATGFRSKRMAYNRKRSG
jgi:hypothetical protein